MKFLIVEPYYRLFLRYYYARSPEAASWSYKDHIQSLLGECFASADFHSKNLSKLGHEATEVIPNNEILQKCWARENGLAVGEPGRGTSFLTMGRQHTYQTITAMLRKLRPSEGSRKHHIFEAALTPLRKLAGKILVPPSEKAWLERILAAQIKAYQPDILYIRAVASPSSQFLSEIKPYVRFILGWCTSRIPETLNLEHYDLILSTAPHYVSRFRSLGVPSEYLRLCFESSILERLADSPPQSGVAFIGQYDPSIWPRRVEVLESVCAELDIDCWGIGLEQLSADSPIHRCYRGQAWGLQMYKSLQLSKIGLNVHGDLGADFAVNERMYEVTGVGTCLVTDIQHNLHELFEPGKEVVAYDSPEDCLEKVRYLLDHEDERVAIARAGQERTLREHTYYHRMQELVDIIKKHI